MKDYYSVTVRATFAVLADSQQEAEDLAREYSPDLSDFPARANVQVDSYLTPNQADYLKRSSVNYEPEPFERRKSV